MKKYIKLFFVASLGAFIALGISTYLNSKKTRQSYVPLYQPTRLVNLPINTNNSIDFTGAAELSIHAVVHVKTSYTINNNYSNDPFFFFYDPFFGGRQPQQQQTPQMGSGSGVIISTDGYIVTNNHVIDKADKIEVTLNDKRTYIAELIGRDPTTDIALLKIKEQNLPYLSYANSDNVKIGEWVLAVGNPFNLTSTVTAGIVSAKGRNINAIENDPSRGLFPIESFIQTDAAVNPGNSGGALVNTRGELIGINTAIASNTGSYTGYSFAVPVNIVRKVVADIIEFGEVQRAFIGVSIRDIDSKLADEKNINTLKGVYVNALTEDGAAEASGIKEGDIIIKVNNLPVGNTSELQEQISRYRPGEKINVTVKRADEEKTFAITLRNKQGGTALHKKETDLNNGNIVFGATIKTLSEEELNKLNLSNGLKITSIGNGKFKLAGINAGFVITSVDKKRINTISELKEVLEAKKGNGVLIEGVYPNGVKAYFGMGV